MTTMNCPRCARELVLRRMEAEGGYRSAVTMRELFECHTCRVAVVSGANIHEDETAEPVPLRRSLLVRERVPSTWPCPACGIALGGLTLAWGGEHLVIESCEVCDVVVVDRGELERIEEMLDESATLQTADLGRVVAATGEPLDADVAALERPIRRFLRAIRLL